MIDYLPVILLTFFGFCALAYLLLAPVYRFLKREEKAGEEWTRTLRSQHLHQDKTSPNGTSTPNTDPEHEAPHS